MPTKKNGLRAEYVGGAQRHRGMHAEFAGLVRCRRDYAAFVGPSPNHDRLAAQSGIRKLFHRDKEGVHINMEDGLGAGGLHKSILAEEFIAVTQRHGEKYATAEMGAKSLDDRVIGRLARQNRDPSSGFPALEQTRGSPPILRMTAI